MVPTKNYKSSNNKTVPNKYKEKTTNLPTVKLQISQQKTTNLPTKNYKSTNKKTTNLPTEKLHISQQKITNLTTIQLSKIKPSTAQHCPLMTHYHQVPTSTALY